MITLSVCCCFYCACRSTSIGIAGLSKLGVAVCLSEMEGLRKELLLLVGKALSPDAG